MYFSRPAVARTPPCCCNQFMNSWLNRTNFFHPPPWLPSLLPPPSWFSYLQQKGSDNCVHPDVASSALGDAACATAQVGPPVLLHAAPLEAGPTSPPPPSLTGDGGRGGGKGGEAGTPGTPPESGGPEEDVALPSDDPHLRKLRSRSVDSVVDPTKQARVPSRDPVGVVDRDPGSGRPVLPSASSSGRTGSPPAESYAAVSKSIAMITGSGVPTADDCTSPSRLAHLPPCPQLGKMLLDLLLYYSKEFHPYEHGVSVLLG